MMSHHWNTDEEFGSKLNVFTQKANSSNSKLGCVLRMVVDFILPMWNSGQMTIGKTHPRLVGNGFLYPFEKFIKIGSIYFASKVNKIE